MHGRIILFLIHKIFSVFFLPFSLSVWIHRFKYIVYLGNHLCFLNFRTYFRDGKTTLLPFIEYSNTSLIWYKKWLLDSSSHAWEIWHTKIKSYLNIDGSKTYIKDHLNYNLTREYEKAEVWVNNPYAIYIFIGNRSIDRIILFIRIIKLFSYYTRLVRFLLNIKSYHNFTL